MLSMTSHKDKQTDICNKSKILIIDDDESMRILLTTILEDEFIVAAINNPQSGLEILKQQEFDLVLLDIMLGTANGIDVLKQIKRMNEQIEVIMITVVKDIRTAVEAMKNGAFDYINKNFEYNEVKHLVRKALNQKKIKTENSSLKEEISQYTAIDYIAGASPRMKQVNKVVERISTMPSNVLIQGESGTGKEIIARRIHELSHKNATHYRPFISVNVASIPSELVESTLFGHEKGAFTGAIKTHRGKFELAHDGTLFLDEIGELRLDLQAKLLRALQEKEIERVGGEIPIHTDARIIAATNQDLQDLVKKGKFREDLFYRLNVIPVKLPPLRERIEDLEELVALFLKKYSHKLNKKVKSVSSHVMQCFQAYSWPGNIRELENVIERLIALSSSEIITEEDLPLELRFLDPVSDKGKIQYDEVLKQATDAFEKRYILTTLSKNGWNQVKTSQNLGIHRKTLEYKIKKLDLQDIIEIKRTLYRQSL